MSDKNLFIVGDVHGCYHTFNKLISHWNPENEILIQVGDLIDRGNFTRQVISLCKNLKNNHPKDSFFLMGNHEWMALNYFEGKEDHQWLKKFGRKILWDYELNEIDFQQDLLWLKGLSLKWENDFIFVSHAGISHSIFSENPDHSEGLLWHKKELKKIEKVQVHGHKPHKEKNPKFSSESNSWNADSGACYGNGLSALKLNHKGEFLESVFIPTMQADIL